MTREQRHYVLIETLISVAINTVISIGFVWLAFGGSSSVAVRALILDAVPQSFMITLMSVLVPGMLTARRLKSGRIAAIPSSSMPWPLGLRALFAAIIAVALGVAVHLVGLSWWSPAAVSFPAVLAIKVAYGAALVAIVTPLMLRSALAANHAP
jgi:hypothetical protein